MRPDESRPGQTSRKTMAPAHAVPSRSLPTLALPVSSDNTTHLGREAEIPARPDAFHGGLHDLSRAKEGGRRHRRADPTGGSGGDDVPRLQGGERRDIAKERGWREEQLRRTAVLDDHSIHSAADAQVSCLVTRPGRHQNRAQRRGGLEVLALIPLRGAPLPVAYRDIVDDGEPGDVRHDPIFADVAPPLADHEGELDLPVDHVRAGGQDEVVVSSAPRGGELGEQRRMDRSLEPRFAKVVQIVETDTDDLARSGDYRREPNLVQLVPTAVCGGRGRAPVGSL